MTGINYLFHQFKMLFPLYNLGVYLICWNLLQSYIMLLFISIPQHLLVFISTPRFRMNYCNFAKVILARATKDKDEIDNFNSLSDNGRINAQCNTSITLPLNIRYHNYITFK